MVFFISIIGIVIFVIFFIAVMNISSSSKRQAEILERNNRQASLDKVVRRECPKCSELIPRKANFCHYCKTDIEPKYVDDLSANRQIIKIVALYKSGADVRDIEKKLNDEGEKDLNDGSDLNAKKIDVILKRYL